MKNYRNGNSNEKIISDSNKKIALQIVKRYLAEKNIDCEKITVKAVEKALAAVGDNLPPKLELFLKNSIFMNCIDGKRYKYEYSKAATFLSKSEFYRIRNAFLQDIINNLHIL